MSARTYVLGAFWTETKCKEVMRWGERGPAVINGSGRDEADVAAALSFAPRPHTKAPLVLKKPGSKAALTGTTFGRNLRPGKRSSTVYSEITANEADRAEESPVIVQANSLTQVSTPLPSLFLVCAGKSVSSNNNDEHLEESSKTSTLYHEKRMPAPTSLEPAKKTPVHSLQHSDSELEFIISELREKISLQHRLEEKQKFAIATASLKSSEPGGTGALDSSRSTGSNSEHPHHHSRRHLKNPVERVNGINLQGAAGVPMLSSSSFNLLKRQQSASHMSRQLTNGNPVKQTPSTVVATSISASSVSRSNLMASASGAGNLHNSSNFQDRGDLDSSSYTRVYDEEGMLIKSYAQEPNNSAGNNSHGSYPASHSHSSTGINGVQRPIVYYGSADPTQRRPTRIRRAMPEIERRSFKLSLEPHRQQQQCENNASDSDSSSFGEDDNSFLLQCSLSPVGPWMASDGWHHFESLDSFDSQYHPSISFRSDMSPLTARSSATEDDFAELSPRSRLLWFSHCADSAEYSTDSLSSTDFLKQCQRSVSHPGTLRPSSTAVKGNGVKPPPVRCSSAKASSSQSRRAGNNTSDFSGMKSKKRPQSGGGGAQKRADPRCKVVT